MPISRTNPLGTRGTRLTLNTVPEGAISTHWELHNDSAGTFTVITTENGSNSANVLDGDLSFLEMWFPPSHAYTVRTRHGLKAGGATSWSSVQTFESRGPLNSFEKYQALSGIKGVDNI